MALTIKGIPDGATFLGISNRDKFFALSPGTSDYVTGGYVITAAMVEMDYILGASVWGVNAAALTAGYIWDFIVATAATPVSGLKQVTLQASGITTGTPGTLVDAASGFNFTGVVVTALFRGY